MKSKLDAIGQLKTRYIALIAAYCAGIFYLSSLSEPPDPGVSFPMLDKLVHIALFGGLAATVSIGIRRSNESVRPWVQWGVPIAFTIVYGILDEVHQAVVPNRTAELSDVAADALGAVLAQLILAAFWRARDAQ